MNNKFTILHAMKDENNKVRLQLDDSIDLENLTASGMILADSTAISFVYLLENKDSYTYIAIPAAYWSVFIDVVSYSLPVEAFNSMQKIELVQFAEELRDLVENIKGNGNYGNEMVEKVETIFSSHS